MRIMLMVWININLNTETKLPCLLRGVWGINNLFMYGVASSSCTEVEHPPHHRKVKGLNSEMLLTPGEIKRAQTSYMQLMFIVYEFAYITVYYCLTFKEGCTCKEYSGNTKGGSITVPLTSCLTGLESTV